MNHPDHDHRPGVSNHSLRPPAFTDKMMWVAIRSHLLAVASAMELTAVKTPLVIAARAALLGIAKAIELRWDLKERRSN